MKINLLILLMAPLCLGAQTLSDGAYILTHPSKRYQTDTNLINSTNRQLEIFFQRKAQIIGLYQIPIEVDPLWYARPTTHFTESYYSHGGEHNLKFPNAAKDSYTLSLSGGYLSACLGRTTSNLIYDFLRPEVKSNTLRLTLLSKSIFTGFLSEKGKLIPETPYWESVLDDSIDGLSFFEVLKLVSNPHTEKFLFETMKIALLKKAPLASRSEKRDFDIIVNYAETEFYLLKSTGPSSKSIIITFLK